MSHAINSPVLKMIECQVYNSIPYRHNNLMCFPVIDSNSGSPYTIIFRDMSDAPGCKWGVINPDCTLIANGLIEMDDAIMVVANKFF